MYVSRYKMKSKHKFYRCTSLKKAGTQFAVSCVLTWFTVGIATEQGNPGQWSPAVKAIAFILAVVFSMVLFNNNVREEKETD